MLENKKYLVAIDLDGTLLQTDKTISEKSKKYLKEFEEKGNFVVITSGRAPRSVQSFYEEIGLKNSPFSAYNGHFAHLGNGLHYDIRLDKNIVLNFYNKTKDLYLNAIKIEGLNTVFQDGSNNFLDMFFNPHGMEIINGNFNDILNEDPFIFVMQIKDPLEINQKKIKEIISEFEGYDVRFWYNCNFGEIYKKGTSKASTLKKIAEFCKVNEENILVFGDADNDIELLSSFKNSFLMKNGIPELKKYAKYITKKDNDHDGVISSIEDFINNDLD